MVWYLIDHLFDFNPSKSLFFFSSNGKGIEPKRKYIKTLKFGFKIGGTHNNKKDNFGFSRVFLTCYF